MSGPFLAIDWGTTNLRAWVVDGDGRPGPRADFDLGVAVWAGARQLGEQLPGLCLGLLGEPPGLFDGQADDAERVEVRLEVVVVRVDVDQEAVWQNCHAVDDAKDYLAHSAVDDGEVGDVGGAGEVELEDGWVDKGDLGSADEGDDVGEGAEEDGESAVELDALDAL